MDITSQEEKLLYALARMVDQYLRTCDGEWDRDGTLDSKAMGAGESAILALVEYGMMEDATENRIMGRWTDAGKKLLLS